MKIRTGSWTVKRTCRPAGLVAWLLVSLTIPVATGASQQADLQGMASDVLAPEAGSDLWIETVERSLIPSDGTGCRGTVARTAAPVPSLCTVEDRMARWNVPGLSVAVIHEGRIAWARGYGVTEAGSETAVTPETLFQAASISKPVAAVAILQLVEDGVLDLDEDVNVYLSHWRIPDNPYDREEKVTLRRILGHRAGLTVHGFPGYAQGTPVPTLVQVLRGEEPANTAPVRVDTIPGVLERYSGGGTTIAELIVEEVTGRPFPDVARDLVLDRVGMRTSTYQQPLPGDRSEEAASAHDGSGAVVPGGWHTYPERAAAGLWTTPSELALLVLELQAALGGAEDRILSPRMARAMLEPQGDGRFGIGFMTSGEGTAVAFHHSGSNRGFRANLRALKHAGSGVIVMANSDRGTHLISEMMEAVQRVYGWPSP